MQGRWVSIVATCGALAALTLAAYWAVLRCDFVSFDDPQYVSQNPHVLAGLSWSGFRYALTTTDCGNWHPLTWISLELDTTLWGKSPFGFHATNLVIHSLNTVLLFLVMNAMTGRLLPSAAVAAFFSVHPLHVESVAWVSERKDVLSTFFLLLTLAAYLYYARRPSVLRYLVIVALFLLGLLAKPMLVTLPILLLLLDFWPLHRWGGGEDWTGVSSRCPRCSMQRLLLEKLPLLGLAFVDGLMTVFAQRNAMKVLTHLPLSVRIANMFEAYLWYLQKTFVPINLAVFYPHLQQDRSWMLVVSGLLVFVCVSIWAVWRLRSNPAAFVGWAWFVISLLPVIGLLQVGGQAFADRYTYIPHIGLFMCLVWEVAVGDRTRGFRPVVSGFTILALVACVGLTSVQVRCWTHSAELWNHAIEVVADNGVAHAHLADVCQDAGDHQRALVHFEQAVKLSGKGYAVDPGWYANAYFRWAQSLLALESFSEAEQKLRAVLDYEKNHVQAIEQLLQLLTRDGRLAEAEQVRQQYGKVLIRQAEKNPETAAGQIKLGLTQARQGNFERAVEHFEQAVRLAPESAAAFNNLGLAKRQLRQVADAKSNFLRAIELNPQLASAHFSLGEILLAEGDFSGAKTHFSAAYRLNPQDGEAKAQLDRLSAQ
jgi:protein O-mannosyl-transferase